MRTHLVRRRSRTPRALKKPPFPGAWSVLVIDSEPIRKKARRDYDKVLRDTEKANLEIERYHSSDLPLYSKWLNSNFGAVLTENREIQVKLHSLMSLVEEVQAEFSFGRHSTVLKAYRKVMWRRENPKEAEAEFETMSKEADAARERFREIFGLDEEDDLFEGEDLEEDFNEVFGGVGFSPRKRVNSSGGRDSRLKDVYRSLVRKLHPDMGGTRSARQVEWWHQAQDAYEQQDLQRLEALLSLTEMHEDNAKTTTVSILQRLTSQFKHALTALRRQLRAYKVEEAWNFSKMADYESLRQRVAERLQAERHKLEFTLGGVREIVESWQRMAAEPEPVRKPRRPRRRAVEAEPWL